MDSQGEGAGLGGGLGGGSEEDSEDDGLRADCGTVSGEAAETVGAADGEAAQAQEPPPARAPSGDNSISTAPSRFQWFEYSLTFPFMTFMEAHFARRILLPVAEFFSGVVPSEITVSGSELTIHLSSGSSFLLRIATACVLGQLYPVLLAMPHYWHYFISKRNPSRSG